MTSRLSGPAVRRASAGPRKTSLQTTHATLFGSVAAAVLTAPTTASVSNTGTTTPQPWAICLAASGTTLTNHELSPSGNRSSEIFDRTKESGQTQQDR